VDRGVRRGDGTVAVSCPHYADNGPVGAPALVFVGSLGTTLAMWEPQIRELSSRFRTIAVDLPGHGGTPVPEARCTVTGFADDVVRLLDSIGVEQFAIVGLSFGGAVAQALAAAYPDRVCAAVIACAAAQYSEEFWRTRAAHVRAEGLEEIVRLTAGRRFCPGFAEREPDTYAASLAILASTLPEGYAACCDALATYDARALLPRITAPTLVIAGELDQVTPPRLAEQIAALVPGARLRVIDGAAHLANVEQPEAFNAMVDQHLLNHEQLHPGRRQAARDTTSPAADRVPSSGTTTWADSRSRPTIVALSTSRT
jgi:3-oxoadipate enol-lactonase / 4-carboxymuconolactone decarboxylase